MHRGNKLVWTDFPREESSGNCRQFVCKYHGWKYDLDGSCAYVQQEGEFFDLDKADYGLISVNVDVWSGFIFVNLDPKPSQTLTEFLGPMITSLEGYPFDKQTERFSYRATVGSNWKLFIDAFFRNSTTHRFCRAASSPVAARPEVQAAGFEGLHYEIEGPHRMVTTYGGQGWRMPAEMLKPMETVTRSGLFGPWDAPDLGVDTLPIGVNPANKKPWGLDSFQIWPNFVLLIWSAAGISRTTTGRRRTTHTCSSSDCHDRFHRSVRPTHSRHFRRAEKPESPRAPSHQSFRGNQRAFLSRRFGRQQAGQGSAHQVVPARHRPSKRLPPRLERRPLRRFSECAALEPKSCDSRSISRLMSPGPKNAGSMYCDT